MKKNYDLIADMLIVPMRMANANGGIDKNNFWVGELSGMLIVLRDLDLVDCDFVSDDAGNFTKLVLDSTHVYDV